MIRHFPYGPSLEPIQARNAAHSNKLRPPTCLARSEFFSISSLYVAKGIKKGFASGIFFRGCCAAAPEKIAGERSILSWRSQRRH